MASSEQTLHECFLFVGFQLHWVFTVCVGFLSCSKVGLLAGYVKLLVEMGSLAAEHEL